MSNTKRHVHADVIHAYAEGAIIQMYMNPDEEWITFEKEGDRPTFNPEWEYRVKPERVFPETTISAASLHEIFNKFDGSSLPAFTAVANAAIKQYILDTESNT